MSRMSQEDQTVTETIISAATVIIDEDVYSIYVEPVTNTSMFKGRVELEDIEIGHTHTYHAIVDVIRYSVDLVLNHKFGV